MMTYVLSGLEKMINGYLHLDAENLARFALLEGNIIQFTVTDWNITFFIHPQAEGVKLSADKTTKPDTVISGTLWGLFKAGLANGQSTALFTHAIEISGDAAVGENIRHILADMDIDWEEQLSKCIGDIAAHKIAVTLKRTVGFGKNVAHTVGDNIKEFLQSETKQVPSSAEMAIFLDDVTTLQNAVDRAEARLNHLQLKRK